MGGESKWRKIKVALGLDTCIDFPRTIDDDESTNSPPFRSQTTPRSSDLRRRMPTTPTFSSASLQSSNYSSKSSSMQICAICLRGMKATNSHTIFTAECSHSFHFHCITSSVKHGNQACPVCRAKWKQIPSVNSGSSRVRPRGHTGAWIDYDSWMRSHTPPQEVQVYEPPVFDDDDELVNQKEDMLSGEFGSNGGLNMKTYPETSSVARSTCFENFNILINLKAPVAKQNLDGRASVDLVTVLDISGSMNGSKIALMKQAMGFLVHNLSPCDRLSVIAFSSSARRLFPLIRMTEAGKRESLEMINLLVANGGTNIAEALKKGAKVMSDRKFKNPVSSMILLSDGQDTHSSLSPRMPDLKLNYQCLLPSILENDETRIPIHTFGFGMDHDARAMHFISERSGGMFSFIESENVIQDAFAQCIGGLLSVVVQDLRVEVECVHPTLQLGTIEAGSYKVGIDENRRSGFVEVGDLYAEEQRDFLVITDIPVDKSGKDMSLVKFRVIYKDPVKKMIVTVGGNEAVIISRPKSASGNVSVEVDRQKNRVQVASAIAKASTLAESGNLAGAVLVLDDCQKRLADTMSGRGGDRLCAALIAELKEMKERMVNASVYEASGRAYMLSGLSSHAWQRATARGDSMDMTSMIQSYQTQSMVDMVNLSHSMCFGPSPSASMVNLDPPVQPPKSRNKKSLRSIHSFPQPRSR